MRMEAAWGHSTANSAVLSRQSGVSPILRPNSASKHSVVQHSVVQYSVVQLEDYSREGIFCGDVHGRDFNGVAGISDK